MSFHFSINIIIEFIISSIIAFIIITLAIITYHIKL
jgi:hypothetical protein